MSNKEEILDRYRDDSTTVGYKAILHTREECYTAMDEYAELRAIEFAEWVKKWYSISKGKYRHRGDFYKNDKKLLTTKELYKLFSDTMDGRG